VIGVEPDQVSPDSVRVCPSVVVPEIAGGLMLLGGTPAITSVGVEVELALPESLVAVATTSIVCPTSRLTRV